MKSKFVKIIFLFISIYQTGFKNFNLNLAHLIRTRRSTKELDIISRRCKIMKQHFVLRNGSHACSAKIETK
jgi:hypothetical protein